MFQYSVSRRKISRLHLDVLNPRVGRGVTTEGEVAEKLLQMYGDEILTLAKDIAKNGLSPLDQWGVVEEGNKIIVLEGNRRLLACRLLLDPSKAPSEKWKSRFKRIKLEVPTEEIDSVTCAKAERRSEMQHWINLRHQGGSKGAGTSSWTSEMKYLDMVNQSGKKEAWAEFWYWLDEQYQDDTELRQTILGARNDQFTLMERLFDWYLNSKLKFSFDGELLHSRFDPDDIKPFIAVLVKAINPKGPVDVSGYASSLPVVNSRSADKKEKTIELLGKLWNKTIGEKNLSEARREEQVSGANEKPQKQESPESTAKGQAAAANQKQTSATRKTYKTKPIAPPKKDDHLYRKVGDPKDLSDEYYRAHKFLSICSNISITKEPDLAGVMARIPLELFVDHYIREFLPNVANEKLFKKVRAVLLNLSPNIESKDTTDDLNLKGAWNAIRTDNETGQLIKGLNDCVHDPKFTDPLGVAERANRVFTPLLVAIIDKLRNTKKS